MRAPRRRGDYLEAALPRAAPGDRGRRPRLSSRLGSRARGGRDPGELDRLTRGDRLDDGLLRRLTALEHADGPSAPKPRDPVGGLEDVVEIVRDEDHAKSLLAETTHELEHLPGLGDAQGTRRPGLDDELRVPHHGTRDGDRLAL